MIIEKSNIFMVGNTGTGKTYLVRTLAAFVKVPITIVDATSYTEAGYVGEDVENILTSLYHAADGDVEATQRGIIYVDECDKISRKHDSPSITRDVSGEGVQQALLKLMEGTIVNISPKGGRKHPEQKMIPINTENILFIFGGAFDGIEKIIEQRLSITPLGFQINEPGSGKGIKQNLLRYLSSIDLKNYGLIPEFVGRVPVITALDPLTPEALYNILTQPKNALIKQYKKLFAMDGIDLSFTEEALQYIVKKALELKLGARALRTLCETITHKAMFQLPSQKTVTAYCIDKEYAIKRFEEARRNILQVA